MKRPLTAVLATALLLAGLPVSGRGQITRYVDVLPAPNAVGLTDLNDVILFRDSHAGLQAFDGPLDADAYIVGPGDHFEINIWSPSARNFQLTLSPEGTLLIPAVGEVSLAGKTLNDARDRILEAVQDAFPGSEITATLTEARRVRVHVSGLVNVPGSYELFASQRLADAVARAGDVIRELGSARRIARTRNGRTTYFDLLRFYAHGDESQNPYLVGGEHIRVAPREPREDQLQISGAVLSPGFIEYRPGDRISDLIRFAFDFVPRADLGNIVVTRMDGAGGQPEMFNVSAQFNSDRWTIDQDLDLVRGDRVYVNFLPTVGRMVTVALYGEVERPGHYSVVEDSTTLSQLVLAAGGLTDKASPLGTQILRLSYPMTIGGDSIPPVVSTNLRDLLAGDPSQDIVLHDRDSVYVPPLSLGVQVLGYVGRPGILTYEAETTAEAYIARAGGFVNQADKGGVRVVRVGSSVLEKPSDKRPPGPGDQILVPGKKPSSARGIIRDVLAVVGVVAVTYIIVDGASK